MDSKKEEIEIKNKKTAIALKILTKSTLTLADSYSDIVESICQDLVQELYDDPELNYERNLDINLLNAYRKACYTRPDYIKEIIESWNEFDAYSAFYENLYQDDIMKSIKVVLQYAEEKGFEEEIIKPLREFSEKTDKADTDAIKFGKAVGQEYWKYLSDKFGTKTNDASTVGWVIDDEINEFPFLKEYAYILHKDINRPGSPKVNITAVFQSWKGGIRVNILLGRIGYTSEHSIGTVEYFPERYGLCLFKKDVDITVAAKTLAKKFNSIYKFIYIRADYYQSLYYIKSSNNPLEEFDGKFNTLDDKDMLNAAVSRWTMCRGKRQKAEIEKESYKDSENFTVLYKNDISKNGRNCKISVEYSNHLFTVRVIKGKDVICEKSSKMYGRVVSNSDVISDTIARCWISANVNVA